MVMLPKIKQALFWLIKKGESLVEAFDAVHIKGFTLVELMVTTSLISVFASLALSSVSDIRLSAEATAKNEIIRQYMQTFVAISTQDRTFPAYPLGIAPGVCLSDDYTDGFCGVDNSHQVHDPFSNRLRQSFSALPKHDTVISNSGSVLEGPIYGCDPHVSDTVCGGYQIAWFQKGENMNCISEEAVVLSADGITICFYSSEGSPFSG